MSSRVKDKRERSRPEALGTRATRERKYGQLQRDGSRKPNPPPLRGQPVVDADHVKAASDRWVAQTRGVAEDPPRGPIDVLLGEATVVGLLYQAHWEPKTRSDGSVVPGFADWSDGPALHARSGYELLELVTAVAKAEADYVSRIETPPGSPMARAQEVLQQLKATLEFLFDDAAHTRGDDQLENLRQLHGRPRSQKTMALALEGYHSLAQDHLAELGKLRGFDLGVLDEALALSVRLRRRRGEIAVAKKSSRVEMAMASRNQLLALLQDRVGRIRRAARLVFQAHPEIVRRFSSDYQRTRRRAARERSRAPASNE